MKKQIKILFISSLFSTSVYSQINQNDSISTQFEKTNHEIENLKKLKVTGWVQAQYQIAESKGISNFDGGNFNTNQYERFMIRRGRVKFTYSQKLSQYVLQVNATERGVNLVEIFGKVTDPWTKFFSLTMGVMNRPFGFEIQQSSADRETPERSRFTQVLLPNERDLGAMLTFQPVKNSVLHGLKVDGGFFNGNGIYVPGTTSTGSTGNTTAAGLVDTDTYKDFIGRAHYKKSFKEDKYTFGVGASYYNGGVAYGSNKVYNTIVADVNGFQKWTAADTSNTSFKNKKAPRIYAGTDIQFSVKSILGTTTIRGEYIKGTQSGSLSENKSLNVTSVNANNTVERQFNGGYVYLVHRIAKTKHELALKYEWYDPNTRISTKDFSTGTSFKSTELKYEMLGLGYINYWDENVKFMIYYNIVRNEKAEGIKDLNAQFKTDLKDNVLTLRMQYRF